MYRYSVLEPETAGAGLFSWSRSRWKGACSGQLLCDLGVLRWQRCGNSYNLSQIITIVTHIERTNKYTFRKVAPAAGGCNTAIRGQGQSGCMRPLCHWSSSELRISVCTKLNDAVLSWLGLVKQVLPSKDAGWLVPMVQSRVRAEFKPGRGQNGATDYCPALDQQQRQQQQQLPKKEGQQQQTAADILYIL